MNTETDQKQKCGDEFHSVTDRPKLDVEFLSVSYTIGMAAFTGAALLTPDAIFLEPPTRNNKRLYFGMLFGALVAFFIAHYFFAISTLTFLVIAFGTVLILKMNAIIGNINTRKENKIPFKDLPQEIQQHESMRDISADQDVIVIPRAAVKEVHIARWQWSLIKTAKRTYKIETGYHYENIRGKFERTGWLPLVSNP
ncbi:MAG TPA: hypothetical protein VMG59_06970 [Phycisphaerae bacterium]|nr:hypothetical protein [Phycisphaerae bacterium]